MTSPPPGEKGWKIEVAPLDVPGAPPSRFVLLRDASLCTSGDLFQHVEIGRKPRADADAAVQGRHPCQRLRSAAGVPVIGVLLDGPCHLVEVLTQLPASFPAPLVLVQHMPAAFTKAFAERLDKLCRIQVKEAEDGDLLRPGLALLAPGGKQMMVDARGAVKILPGDERLNYKPCVDITFGSAAKSYGDKVLSVVLTGMGADGREGARLLKQGGSTVWAQDEASCVIYGMPMAIVKANLADAVYSLDEIGKHLVEACV